MSYRKGVELFQSNKFDEAKRELSLALNQLDDSKELRDSYALIVNILKIQNKYEELCVTLYEYGCELLKANLVEDAVDALEESYSLFYALNIKRREQVNIKVLSVALWDALIAIGEIEKSKSVAKKYLDYLISKKNFVEGNIILERILKVYPKSDFTFNMSIIFSLLENDMEKVDLIFSSLSNGRVLSPSVIAKASSYLPRAKRFECDTVESIYLLAASVSELLEELESRKKIGNNDVSLRKTITNTLYQFILKYPSEPFGQYLVLKYAVLCERKKLILQAEQIVKTNSAWFKGAGKLLSLCEDLIVTGESIEDRDEDEIAIDEEFDMATDLFAAPSRDEENMRAAKAIGFLIERGEDDRAKELMEKIQGNKIEDTSVKMDKAFELTDDRQVREVELELLAELDLLSKKYSFDDDQPDDLGIKKAIEHMDDAELVSSYSDLVVALHGLQMYRLADNILIRAEKDVLRSEDINKRLEYKYLKIVTLVGQNSLHEALTVADEVSRLWPLSDSEKKCFLYEKGEIHRMLGDIGRAMDAFIAVAKIDENYRLVGDRIKNIEQDK